MLLDKILAFIRAHNARPDATSQMAGIQQQQREQDLILKNIEGWFKQLLEALKRIEDKLDRQPRRATDID